MFPKSRAIIVADVAVKIAELVKPFEWRGMNAKMYRPSWDGSYQFARVSLVDGIVIRDDLIDRQYTFMLLHGVTSQNQGQ